jgi:hypothetical protein
MKKLDRRTFVFWAIGVFLFSIIITLAIFQTDSKFDLHAINPLGAATAITIAIIGMVWFKKTSN